MTLRTLPQYCAPHQLRWHLLRLEPDEIAGRKLFGDGPALRWLSHVFGTKVVIMPDKITVRYQDGDTIIYATPAWLREFQRYFDIHEGPITAELALEILRECVERARRVA
jgi:hypothetical protein